jgi:hypothetical protein
MRNTCKIFEGNFMKYMTTWDTEELEGCNWDGYRNRKQGLGMGDNRTG